jgi:hypothetical protein
MNATTTDEDYIKGQFVAFGSAGMYEAMSLLLQPTQGLVVGFQCKVS